MISRISQSASQPTASIGFKQSKKDINSQPNLVSVEKESESPKSFWMQVKTFLVSCLKGMDQSDWRFQ